MHRFLERFGNPDVLTLQPYQPGKPVEELTRELGITDIVKLASNENPRGPGRAVQMALSQAGQSLSRYPDGSGYRLKQKLSAHLGVSTTALSLGNGSNDVLELLARIALTRGAQAIVSAHAFVVYPLAVIANGGRLVTVPARQWGCDLDAMAAAITDETRLIFIANPNNPTGTWVARTALTTFLDRVPDHVLVVLDEAYFEYVEEAEFPDGVSLLPRYPNLVVTRTFSKIHGLAALRVGYAVSDPAIADVLNRVRQPFNVSSIGLECAEAALGDHEFVKQSREINREGMKQLTSGLTQLGVSYIPSVGNFLAIDLGRPARATYDALLRAGVIVRPIAGYDMPNHLRVTVGLAAENARFLDALAQVL
ncbi:MAG: histidinol-phosphate transaminase [Gammaproteobacteria bacterium]|nr:histidinol-phosphate transaminase [Gammaproteobacteria bacterium]